MVKILKIDMQVGSKDWLPFWPLGDARFGTEGRRLESRSCPIAERAKSLLRFPHFCLQLVPSLYSILQVLTVIERQLCNLCYDTAFLDM
jgi:hypothetical protein